MTNRAARRRTASSIDPRERSAFMRLEQMKQAGRMVPLSNAAAARALMQVSPAARRMFLGMVAVHSQCGGGRTLLEDAVRAMGGRTLSWSVLDELHAVGLMRFNQHGRHEMHPLFGSIAHRLFEFGHGADNEGNGNTANNNDNKFQVFEFAAGAH